MFGSDEMTTTAPPFTASPALAAAANSMRVAYGADGTAVYKSVPSSSPTYHQPSATGGGGGGGESEVPPPVTPYGLNMNVGKQAAALKKKRGRPRKYGTDGTTELALMPARPTSTTPTAAPQSSAGGAFSPPSGPPPPSGFSDGSLSSSIKKARGRPPGSVSHRKQRKDSIGSGGVGFTPHVISVKAGEDMTSKIMSFSQNGPRAVCILSANGAISNVTLCQAATSGGTATYEGRFEILSLCGSFLLTEVAGQRSRTGGLSISLAGPDGRILGGCVAGLLTAASPVQVIVGSFIPDGRKESKPGFVKNHTQPMFCSPLMPVPVPFSGDGEGGGGDATAAVGSSPLSRGEGDGGGGCSISETSGGDGKSPPQPDRNIIGNSSHNGNNPQPMIGVMQWR